MRAGGHKHQTKCTAAKTRRKQNRRGRGKGRQSAKAVDTSGQKPEKASDNKGAQRGRRKKKHKERKEANKRTG